LPRFSRKTGIGGVCAASQNHALRRQHHFHALRLVDVPAAVLDEARKVRRLIARLDQRAVDAVRLLVQLDTCGRVVLLVACRLSGVRVVIAEYDVAQGDRAALHPQLGVGVAGLCPRAARSTQAWTKSAGTAGFGSEHRNPFRGIHING